MERLLARLERRLGRYAVPNLMLYICAGMALVWVLSLSRPEVLARVDLDMAAVARGQVWRLVTFLFIPPRSSALWILINLYFAWWMGSSLESHWGAFKFNVYYLVGAVGTIVAGVIVGNASNFWLDASLLLALATVAPDMTVLIMFVLPLSLKWLGFLTAAFVGYGFVTGGWSARASILAALLNYVLFFSGHWVRFFRERETVARQGARRAASRSVPPVFGERACAICGAREADGADIRVCSCERCGGKPRPLCLQHAREH